MDFLQSAMELKEEMVRDRRYLHQNPEIGMELPKTTEYVINRLNEMGYDAKRVGKSGVTALLTGKKEKKGVEGEGNEAAGAEGGRVFLLRADMDALPMKEMSGLPFSSDGDCAHTCGHDMHTAMLLGAARLLKDAEKELPGMVKFMFQPGEEILTGARDMIAHGILENPKVDAAMGGHMMPMLPVGMVGYGKGCVSASSDHLRITIAGKGGHGAHPQDTIDPINIGVHIHLALQELLSREISPSESVVLTFGKFTGGDAANIIPAFMVMEGTLRTFNETLRAQILERIKEICECTAKAFRGSVAIELKGSTSALQIDSKTTDIVAEGWKKEEGLESALSDQRMSGSEDFAEIAKLVPSTFFVLGGGTADEGCRAGLHSPALVLSEACLPYGAAAYASGAEAWLQAAE